MHEFPLYSLVELNSGDIHEENSRLYIVEHTFNNKNEPCYTLSHNRTALIKNLPTHFLLRDIPERNVCLINKPEYIEITLFKKGGIREVTSCIHPDFIDMHQVDYYQFGNSLNYTYKDNRWHCRGLHVIATHDCHMYLDYIEINGYEVIVCYPTDNGILYPFHDASSTSQYYPIEKEHYAIEQFYKRIQQDYPRHQIGEYYTYSEIVTVCSNEVNFNSHYRYLNAILPLFWKLYFNEDLYHSGHPGIISAHGDKFYSSKYELEKHAMSFNRAVLIYLLTYTKELGDTPKHQSEQWVIDNYSKYLPYMLKAEEMYIEQLKGKLNDY